MKRASRTRLESAIMLADIGGVVLALLIAINLHPSTAIHSWARLLREALPLLFGTILVWLAVSDRLALNQVQRGFADLLSRAVVASSILSMGVAALAFITKVPFSRLAIGIFVVAFFLMALTSRLLLRALMLREGSVGRRKYVAIIGGGPIARELAEKIEENPACELVGCLVPESQESGVPIADNALRETVSTLSVAKHLALKNVEQVYIVLPNSGDSEVQKLVAECRNASIEVAFVPHAYELYVSRAITHDIGGIPLISFERYTSSPHSRVIKTLADSFTAAVLLVITAPVLVVSAVVLRLKHGKALRRELRCGEAGRTFGMYRFSVDRYSAELDRFEQFLVRTSISELPQIFNVLRGDMSIVGPRPEPPDRVRHYSEWEKQRLLYIPGITGFAQVRGLREQHSSDAKTRYDLQYPLSWSPLLDLTILVQTALTVAGRAYNETQSAMETKRRHSETLRPQTVNAVKTFTPEIVNADRSQPSAD
ncbi:MAG TPA: sugar transferase [Clostridia bacterium]|nr:sugar transferase [Clostridia bacterium]